MANAPLAPWAPDQSPLAGGTAEAFNVLPTTATAYGPWGAPAAVTTTQLPVPCIGLFSTVSTATPPITEPDDGGGGSGDGSDGGGAVVVVQAGGGVATTFAAVAGGVYAQAGANSAWVSTGIGGPAFTGPSVRFTQFKSYVIATDGAIPVQYYDFASSTFFQTLSTAAPTARFVASVRDFLMLGDTTDPVGGHSQYRIWWSGVGAPASWPTAGSALAQQEQSDYNDFTGADGAITGFATNLTNADFAVFFERSIQRGIYVGPPDIFEFQEADGTKGLMCPDSLVPVGPLNYYISDDGFYSFDGSFSTPIGQGAVDTWFFNNLNLAYKANTFGAYDGASRTAIWAFPSRASTYGAPDSLIAYSPQYKRWTHAVTPFPMQRLARVLPATTAGVIPRASVVMASGALSTFTGPPMAAIMSTAETQLTPNAQTLVRNVVPLVDGGSPAVSLAYRSRLMDPLTVTPEVGLNSAGECPFRIDARYVSTVIKMGAGDTWTHAEGAIIEGTPAGTRAPQSSTIATSGPVAAAAYAAATPLQILTVPPVVVAPAVPPAPVPTITGVTLTPAASTPGMAGAVIGTLMATATGGTLTAPTYTLNDPAGNFQIVNGNQLGFLSSMVGLGTYAPSIIVSASNALSALFAVPITIAAAAPTSVITSLTLTPSSATTAAAGVVIGALAVTHTGAALSGLTFAVSGASGNFEISGGTNVAFANGSVPAGSYTLTVMASASNAASVSYPVTVTVSAAVVPSVITGVTLTPSTAVQAAGGTAVSSVSVQSTGPALVNQVVALTGSGGGDFALSGAALSLLPNGVPPSTYSLTFRVSADNASTASFTVPFVLTAAPVETITVNSVSPLVATLPTTVSATFANGPLTSVTATLDGSPLTFTATPTISSGSSGTITGTFTAPTAGVHSLVLTGGGVSSAAFSFTTVPVSVITGVTLAPSTAVQSSGSSSVGFLTTTNTGPALTGVSCTLASPVSNFAVSGGNLVLIQTGGEAAGTYTLQITVSAFNAVSATFPVTVTVTGGASMFDLGPNVASVGSGAITGPVVTYASGDLLSFRERTGAATLGQHTIIINDNNFAWYFDNNGLPNVYFYTSELNVAATTVEAAGGDVGVDIDQANSAVRFYYSTDGKSLKDSTKTWTLDATRSLGGNVFASGTAMTTTCPFVYGWTIARNGAAVSQVDFSNAALGTDTVVPDAISGSWTLTGGAKIIAETAPSITMPAVTLYDNAPTGTIAGVPVITTATGTSILSYSGMTALSLSGGDLVVSGSLAGLAGTTITGTLTVSDGIRSTALPVSRTISAGTTLPSSNISNTFSTTLTNASANPFFNLVAAVGTVTAAGFTNPTILISMLNDERQSLTAYGGGANPRYTWTTSGATATVSATQLSAQTDTLIVTFVEGANVCTASIALTVAAKVGPTINVGDGQTYATWNAAADYAWTNYPACDGAIVILHPRSTNYSDDFSRTQIGHGNSQMWWPGPVTYQGVSAVSKTLISFGGLAPYETKGGIARVTHDTTFKWLELAHCSNVSYGAGNAAAIYIEAQSSGNVTMEDLYIHDCNNGILNGDVGTHVSATNLIVEKCGVGEGGLVHNIYVGHVSSATFTNCQSYDTGQVHCLKSRAARTTITGGIFGDGLIGRASNVIDFPIGGQFSISGALIIKGANPNNNPNMVEMCEEGAINGPLWNTNIGTITNCTFVSSSKPGSYTANAGLAVAVALWSPALSPLTGAQATITVSNCQFYNISASQRFQVGYGGGTASATDGGGNTSLTTWTNISAIDNETFGAISPNPDAPWSDGAANASSGIADIMTPPGVMQLSLPTSTTVGTLVTTLSAFDNVGAALTGCTYTLLNNNSGVFSTTGNAIHTATAITNALLWVNVQCVGTSATQGVLTLTKWLPVVGGNGYVAAA